MKWAVHSDFPSSCKAIASTGGRYASAPACLGFCSCQKLLLTPAPCLQVREDLRNMIRLFRRNQGTRFVTDKRWMIHLLGVDDPPPDLVIEHFAETPPARSMADMSSHTPRSIYASHPNNQLASAAVNGSWWQDDASASQGGLQERRNGAR